MLSRFDHCGMVICVKEDAHWQNYRVFIFHTAPQPQRNMQSHTASVILESSRDHRGMRYPMEMRGCLYHTSNDSRKIVYPNAKEILPLNSTPSRVAFEGISTFSISLDQNLLTNCINIGRASSKVISVV